MLSLLNASNTVTDFSSGGLGNSGDDAYKILNTIRDCFDCIYDCMNDFVFFPGQAYQFTLWNVFQYGMSALIFCWVASIVVRKLF